MMGQIQTTTYGNEQLHTYVMNGANSAILTLPLVNNPFPGPIPSETYTAPAAHTGCYPSAYVLSGFIGSSYYLAGTKSSVPCDTFYFLLREHANVNIPSVVRHYSQSDLYHHGHHIGCRDTPCRHSYRQKLHAGGYIYTYWHSAWTRSHGLGLAGQYSPESGAL